MIIQNTDLKNAIKDAISANTLEGLPTQLLDKVAPVIDVNPFPKIKITHTKTLTTTTSGSSQNILIEPKKQIYLCGADLTVIKDVACDVATGTMSIGIIQNGLTTYLINLPVVTTTAETKFSNVQFINPIKIDYGSTIFLSSGTFAAGNCTRRATVYYYESSSF